MKAREQGNESDGEAKVKGLLANKSARLLGKVKKNERKEVQKPTVSKGVMKEIVKKDCCGEKMENEEEHRLPRRIERMTLTEEGDREGNGEEEGEVDQTNDEMREYLEKLQELVPFTPKNTKLSKLEVITSAIFYIRDLRETLGLPPCHPDIPSTDVSEEDASTTDLDTDDETSSQFPVPSPWQLSTSSNPTFVTEVPSPPKTLLPPKSPLSPGNSPQNRHSPGALKRQPLCVIATPRNNLPSTGQNQNQRLSQKS